MDHLAALRLAADYNAWVNTRLYDACASLSPADYRADQGAFFRSVHGTLNHLLLGDRLWLGRIQGRAAQFTRLDTEICADLQGLRAQRLATDQAIADGVRSLAQADLDRPLRDVSILTGQPMTLPLWVAWMHLFNHQMHHRGQLTALLTRLGVDYGDIDLVWMPGVAMVGEAAATDGPPQGAGP